MPAVLKFIFNKWYNLSFGFIYMIFKFFWCLFAFSPRQDARLDIAFGSKVKNALKISLNLIRIEPKTQVLTLFLPFLLFAEELEIRLATRSSLKPLYLAQVDSDTSLTDWRYAEDLRAILEFDLKSGGFASVVPMKKEWEERLSWPAARHGLDLSLWREAKIPFVVVFRVGRNALSAIAFDVERNASKKYPDIALTGKLEEDRRSLHRLSDLLHRDLFGVEGIASLRILYSQRTFPSIEGERASEIWICDADGANAKQLTFEEGYCVCPSFFPRMPPKDFFYVSFKEGQSKIYRSSLTQPRGELFVSLRGNQALPAISRQGNKIAFITDVAGRPDLFIQSLDAKGLPIGKARQLFSAPRATQASPTFSPDGARIAFVSDKDGTPRIYILSVKEAHGTKKPRPILLTKRNRENTSPAWSPDGKKLAYSAKTEGVRQIWVYDFATEEETQLTSGPEAKENPTWAPDSLHLIYNTESEESCELYLVHLLNSDPILLSKGVGHKRFPCWEMRR